MLILGNPFPLTPTFSRREGARVRGKLTSSSLHHPPGNNRQGDHHDQPGATHNLPHGVCNAILLPIIENFNRPNAVARFARVAQAMGVDTRGMSDEAASMEAINAIRTLSKRVGIPQGFSQLGVSKADIEGWLDKALADPCAPCNPRPASRDEVRELYLEAL